MRKFIFVLALGISLVASLDLLAGTDFDERQFLKGLLHSQRTALRALGGIETSCAARLKFLNPVFPQKVRGGISNSIFQLESRLRQLNAPLIAKARFERAIRRLDGRTFNADFKVVGYKFGAPSFTPTEIPLEYDFEYQFRKGDSPGNIQVLVSIISKLGRSAGFTLFLSPKAESGDKKIYLQASGKTSYPYGWFSHVTPPDQEHAFEIDLKNRTITFFMIRPGTSSILFSKTLPL